MTLMIELDRETNGRWIAEVPELPGVLAYGESKAEAISRVKASALVELGERMLHREPIPGGPSSRASRSERRDMAVFFDRLRPTSLAWRTFQHPLFFRWIMPDADGETYAEPDDDDYLDRESLDVSGEIPPLLLGHHPVEAQRAPYLQAAWCEGHPDRAEAKVVCMAVRAAGETLGRAVPIPPHV